MPQNPHGHGYSKSKGKGKPSWESPRSSAVVLPACTLG